MQAEEQRKRRRVVQAAAVGVAAVLLLGIAGTTVGLVRAEGGQATRRADAAKVQSEANLAETQAVLNFVENKVFAAARPEGQDGGLGHEVTLKRAIQSAVPFVEDGFREQPLIEARLRRTLGTSFSYLGEAETARAMFQRSRELYAARLGPDHPDTLMSMNNLANSYAALGRHAEALALREETLELRKAKLGPDHPDTLKSMNNLAVSYAALGRHAEALALLEETLKLHKAKLGPDHPDTLGSMNNLAISYAALGRHAEALALREETLRLQKAKLGPDHPDTLRSMNNLAISYAALGRHAEALALREETLKLRKVKLGPDHPDTLNEHGQPGPFVGPGEAWGRGHPDHRRLRPPLRRQDGRSPADPERDEPAPAALRGGPGCRRLPGHRRDVGATRPHRRRQLVQSGLLSGRDCRRPRRGPGCRRGPARRRGGRPGDGVAAARPSPPGTRIADTWKKDKDLDALRSAAGLPRADRVAAEGSRRRPPSGTK